MAGSLLARIPWMPQVGPMPTTGSRGTLNSLGNQHLTGSPRLQLRLFGGASLEKDGVPVRGRSAQRRRIAILAILAINPRQGLSRERIISLLWRDSAPEQARKLLSEALYVIRRELGDDVLISEGDDLRLNGSMLFSDVRAFREALAAGHASLGVSLYAGPLLDGWYVDGATEFERWIEEHRARLAEEHAAAVLEVIRVAEKEDRWTDAATLWRRLGDIDPHRASYAIGLALALTMAGERPAALHALTRYQARLRAEFEVEPDDEVVRLERRLRRDGKLTPTNAARAPSPPPADEPHASVEPSDEQAAQTAASSSTPAAAVVRTPRWNKVLPVVGVVTALLLAFAFNRRAAPSPSAPSQPNRLAVLYFRDASVEQDLGPTADVITEALIEQLAGVNAFQVVPGAAVKRFRSSAVDVDSVARTLHAGSVVDGTVQHLDDRLIVSIRLTNASTGAVTWSSHFEAAPENLLELQRRIASEVASAIRHRLGTEVRLRELAVGTSNERARQLVARGNRERDDARELLERTATRGDVKAIARLLYTADSLYAQAHAEDPQWTRPLVERGWTALMRAPLERDNGKAAAFGAAIRFANQALDIVGDAPTALELRGSARWRMYIQAAGGGRDSSEVTMARADLEQAVGRDSLLARGWATLSNVYWISNNPSLSYLAGRRALNADTYLEDSPRILRNLISALLLREWLDPATRVAALDSARQLCARGREQFPSQWAFAECSLTIMKYDEYSRPDVKRAKALIAALDSMDPPSAAASAGHAYSPLYRRLVLAAVLARAGDRRTARAILVDQKREAVRLDAGAGPNVQLDLIPDEITLLLTFGDTTGASELLDSAIAARPILKGIAARDPLLLRAVRRKPEGRPWQRDSLAAAAGQSPRR